MPTAQHTRFLGAFPASGQHPRGISTRMKGNTTTSFVRKLFTALNDDTNIASGAISWCKGEDGTGSFIVMKPKNLSTRSRSDLV